jgi:hypothetical protein
VERELSDPRSLRHQVFQRLKQLLAVRSRTSAFDPVQPPRVIELNPAILALERSPVLCLHNVTAQPQAVTLDPQWAQARDLLSDRRVARDWTLRPYEVIWLQYE